MTNIGVSVPEEDLAVRCEQATDADEKLDSDIWHAVGRPQEYLVHDLKLDPPDYTASLDAAMTLVPEGWRKSIDDADNGDGLVEVWCDEHDSIYARAATWPLALCAAALRARVQGHSS